MASKRAKRGVTSPPYELHTGDCIKLMPKLFKDRKANLVVADAPYNYGEPYDKYQDNVPWSAYLNWSHQWISAVTDAAASDASMFLFYPDELVSWIDVMCQAEYGWHKRGHIIWSYTFGVCNSKAKNFSRSHTHILYYTKKKTVFHFDAEEAMVPSARALKYADKRANPGGKVPDNTWVLLKEHLDEVITTDSDTWLESRVCGTYKERQKDSPNQLPVPLVERIVRVASKPGDLVLDPFSGSGTTVLAAVTNGRKAVGLELSERYNVNADARIRSAVGA